MYELHHKRKYKFRKMRHICRCEVYVYSIPGASTQTPHEASSEQPGAAEVADDLSFWNEVRGLGSVGFLADWMGAIMPAIRGLTLFDLCLPGSHDSVTFDLSSTIAQGDTVGEKVRKFGKMVKKVGRVVKSAAICQRLDLEEQLNSGIRLEPLMLMIRSSDMHFRFLDMRIHHTHGDWYGLHAVITNQRAIHYFTAIEQV